MVDFAVYSVNAGVIAAQTNKSFFAQFQAARHNELSNACTLAAMKKRWPGTAATA